MNTHWEEIADLQIVASPGLLVDADRVAGNLQSMLAMVDGQVARLRPHVKTHKMPNVIRMQVAVGVTSFKAATIAESSMAADAGAKDILLAYQLVGPNLHRFTELIERFPQTSFAAIVDNTDSLDSLAASGACSRQPLRVFIDVDCGMHRTGVEFGPDLDRLRDQIESCDGIEYAGLHVYDGHLHAPSLDQRRSEAGVIAAKVIEYEQSNPSPTIVAGGSPTFSFWAGTTNWQCSPGTPIFWDVGYGTCYPEMEFAVAAVLVTRVISKPGNHRVCLDLGYKSVASEMPLKERVVIPAIPDAEFVGHSEEHLILETDNASNIAIGDTFLAYPRHVCPTVALHEHATVVRGGKVTNDCWPVTARNR